MKRNQIGKSDLQISPISFGCMSLGENQSTNRDIIRKAAEQGINYFDTADIYQNGMNEENVGEALKPIRKDIILATKVGNVLRADGKGMDWNPSKAHILKSIDESLTRLKTDYIDLYQLHGGTIDDPIDETIEAFEELKKSGKIRWYGISSIRPNVIREYVRRSNVVSVMMQYSLLDRRPEEAVLSLLQENQISVLCRGVVAKGMLIGKEADSYLQYTSSEVHKAAKAITSMAADTGVSKLQVATAYVHNSPAVATSVLGIRTAAQLADAVKAVNYPLSLDESQVNVLRHEVRGIFYEEHR